MNEVRVVLVGFAVLALIMIGLPIMTVLTASKTVPDIQAETGAVSRFFRVGEVWPQGHNARRIPASATVLPLGTTQEAAYETLHASGFRCEPDAGSAACFRTTKTATLCPTEWRVRMTFDSAGRITASDALDTTTCP